MLFSRRPSSHTRSTSCRCIARWWRSTIDSRSACSCLRSVALSRDGSSGSENGSVMGAHCAAAPVRLYTGPMQTPPFVSHCLELFAPLGQVRARRMFGGHGIYLDGLFIALIAGERLYLKSDPTRRAAFERAGCQPFAYSRRDAEAVTLGYWSAPDEALDSPRAM